MLRFHDYGEPASVLRPEEVAVPEPHAGQIRVRVHACGLNPAEWFLCRGLFAGDLPRGVSLAVSGTVDAVGAGVSDGDDAQRAGDRGRGRHVRRGRLRALGADVTPYGAGRGTRTRRRQP